MKNQLSSLVLAIALASSTPLAAAPLAGPAPAIQRARPSAEAVQVALELMEVIKIQQQMDLLMTSLLPALLDGAGSGLTDKEKDVMVASAREAVGVIMPKFTAAVAEKYAEIFTEREMRDAIAFYTSASGKAFLAKQAQLVPVGQEAMQSLMPEFQSELRRRVCSRIKCTAANGLGTT